MEIIYIGNQASNIGKTATVLSLASCLSALGYRVLLIDLESTASNICLASNVHKTVVDVLGGSVRLPDAITHTDTFDILPVPDSSMVMDKNIPLSRCYESRFVLRAILRERTQYSLAEQYDFVLIDALRDSMVTESAIVASDSIIIPCDLSAYALHGCQNMLYDISALQKECRIQSRIEGIALTRFTLRWASNRSVHNEIINLASQMHIEIYQTPLRESGAVDKAMHTKRTILEYKKIGHGAADAMDFTVEFLRRRGLIPKIEYLI